MTEAIHTNRKKPKAAYESEKQIGKFVLGLLIVPVVSFLGLVFQSQLEGVLLSFKVPWALPLLDPAAISTTWLAILAVHSAIGAIAPFCCIHQNTAAPISSNPNTVLKVVIPKSTMQPKSPQIIGPPREGQVTVCFTEVTPFMAYV